MPSSRAISAIGRPEVRTSSTASRLNSAVNQRRFLGCLSSMRTSSAQGRCPASGGKSNYLVVPSGWAGQVPDGLVPIHAPTVYVWIIGRTQTDGPADYQAVHQV